ncbi:unnamed protein product [Eruca vesicaria subsp. sativa]|uniref:KIB1-4 beta-propeller domain-containing protein n=1 Tax=Eruca vesicaria subsp. sativa TaxID=29727 RepID=A0ABC8LA53_ERUVS|nr:unnamed protein product [Eruca vesicaria subsp. sativa]
MKDRHPWFMKYSLSPRNTGPCELHDPMQRMSYLIYFPEIIGMSVHHAKDGWLLMYKKLSSELFFFNPLTKKRINLPSCECYNESAAFTCAPTSESCLVFGMAHIHNYNVGINTLKLGETKWDTTCSMSFERNLSSNNKIIFLEGLFYCLFGLDWISVFDPSKRTMEGYCIKYDRSLGQGSTGTYFVEIKGDIFLIKTFTDEKLRLFRLNQDRAGWSWEEKDKIDEASTIFGASCVSECRSDLPKCLRSKLLLSDAPHPMINTYYFDGGRYVTNDSEIPFWDRAAKYQCVWIEPPKQCLDFI